jgi:hypothetical protein
MSEIANAEAFYDVDLKKPFREISALYWRWSKDMLANKPIQGHYYELCRVEFLTFSIICEEIIKRLTELVKSHDRLFLIDTSQLNVAIEQARQRKINAEKYSGDDSKIDECIKSMKVNVEEIFKVYSDWRAKRKNTERKALTKWISILGGSYLGTMVVYYQVLTYMQIYANLTFGITVPVFIGLLLLLALFAIFSQE